jgi:hypothetical protein
MGFRDQAITRSEEPAMSDQSRHDENLTSLGVLIAVVLALGIGKWLFFSDTVTAYWIYTQSGAPAAREVYSVDRPSLTVAVLSKWSNGLNWLNGPYRKCVVIDSNNWRCEDGGLEAEDGRVKGSVLDSDTRVSKVSWFRWRFARLTHWSKPEEETNNTAR